jgi:hypothetical protein
MMAEAKVVVHAWLRSGNTASARGVKALLAETLARLPTDFRLYALRVESGFLSLALSSSSNAARCLTRSQCG